MEKAVQAITALGGIACSAHILIADSATSLGLELSPRGDVHLKENEHGIITHTNHFIENQHVVQQQPLWSQSSPYRLARINQLSTELVGKGLERESITPALLRDSIFSDTCNAPYSISAREEDPSRHWTVRSITLFNIVMNLDARNPQAEVVMGQPGTGTEGPVIMMPWE